MSRFYDRICRQPYGSDWVKELSECVVVKADNVFEYLEHYASESAERNINSVPLRQLTPNVAPPFPLMFIESKISRFPSEMGCVAALIASSKIKDGWNLSTLVFAENLIPTEPIWQYEIICDENGLLPMPCEFGHNPSPTAVQFYGRHELDDIEFLEFLRDWFLNSIVAPALLTLSFMHCKNVEAVEHKPPDKLNKKHEKRHHRPLTRYYTLGIDPMKKIIKTEGRVDEVGLKRALHICRGHFKDYSNGKGLFGKYKGLYWWDMRVSGNSENGTVVKDYKVLTQSKL